jgi:hypothetical protein
MILILTASVLMTGCVGPAVVVMKNTTTGELVQCRGTSTVSIRAESKAAEDCAQGYVSAGWTRMN